MPRVVVIGAGNVGCAIADERARTRRTRERFGAPWHPETLTGF